MSKWKITQIPSQSWKRVPVFKGRASRNSNNRPPPPVKKAAACHQRQIEQAIVRAMGVRRTG